MNHLEEIRAKINIEELVSGYVQLKKAGRNLKGLCPFHNDSRPSFMVSPEKGIAYCFSCNTGGDIFKFIQLVEKVEFPEAVRLLAERTGTNIPTFKPEAQDEKRRILAANEKTSQFFASELKKSNIASNYFKERGLTDQSIEVFKLGYAPDSYQQLKNHLVGLGFSEAELLKGGLLNQKSIADKNTYARFRNRVMFPIADQQDNIVGFGGRILSDGEPKYLNSPDTPAYNKSYVLYGLNLAKESIKKEELAIFVEGYMDVIACHQAGSKNVIATSGTALTPGQLKLIKRYTKNIAFAFDQDDAGLQATSRAIELAQEAELNIKIIEVPNGKDPDECLKEDKEAWFKAIEQAMPVMDFYFNLAFKKHKKDTIEGKKGITELLLPIIKGYSTSMEQNEYLKRLAFELKTDSRFLWEDMKKIKQTQNNYGNKVEEKKPVNPSSFSREEFLIGFILSYPQLYGYLKDHLIENISFDPKTEIVYKTMKSMYDSLGVIEPNKLKNELPEALGENISILPLMIDERYPDINEEKAASEVAILIKNINLKNIKTVQKEYEFKIRSTQDAGERTILLNKYNQILKLSSKLR